MSVTITFADFEKLLKLLKREQADGALLTFWVGGTKLGIRTMDRQGKEMNIELHDKDYPMMPTITKTESF